MTTTILVVAYDRPTYLHQVVDGLLAMRGVGQCRIVVSIDGLPTGGCNQGVLDLAKSLDPDDIRVRPHLDCNGHVRQALQEMLDEGCQDLLYIEDDIVPAPDCLEWCHEMGVLMQHHQRIHALNLIGQNHGDVHLAWRNRHGFKAQRWFNAWGNYWHRRGLREVLETWPLSWGAETGTPWDVKVKDRFLQHDWLTLSPLLSRIKNIGTTGRYFKTPQAQAVAVCDFWSGDDFSRPVGADFH